MKKSTQSGSTKSGSPSVKTPTPPQVMNPTKGPGKQTSDGKNQKSNGKPDRELAPNEEL